MSAPATAGCVHCNAPVDPARDYRHVQGWERANRRQGGTNALRLRHVTPDTWACAPCIDRAAHGHADQLNLITDA